MKSNNLIEKRVEIRKGNNVFIKSMKMFKAYSIFVFPNNSCRAICHKIFNLKNRTNFLFFSKKDKKFNIFCFLFISSIFTPDVKMNGIIKKTTKFWRKFERNSSFLHNILIHLGRTIFLAMFYPRFIQLLQKKLLVWVLKNRKNIPKQHTKKKYDDYLQQINLNRKTLL